MAVWIVSRWITSAMPVATFNRLVAQAAAVRVTNGTLLMFPLGGAPLASPTLVSTIGSASALQAGRDFVFWQNDDNTYGMYDAAAKTDINVGDILTGAQFLAVNGNTAAWTVNNAQDTPTATTATTATTGAGQFATLMAFNWPRK